MSDNSIYNDITKRTGGDIYIGASVIIGLNQKSRIIRCFDGLVQFLFHGKKEEIK